MRVPFLYKYDMIGSAIIAGMKSALKLGGKLAKRVGKRIGSNKFVRRSRKKATVVLGRFGKRMAQNVQSRRWWGKAVRTIRSRKRMLGMVGKIGKGLASAGGGLGWLGKGLSAFDIDFRSPREYKKDMKLKENQLKELKKSKDRILEQERKAIAELKNKPIDVSSLETSEEKLDSLAGHLSEMKSAIGDIRANSHESNSRIKSFEDHQMKVNEALGDAITTGNTTSLKATLAGIEDTKTQNAAISADATGTVVSEISGKIEAIEEEKRKEAEHRRKNDWKRKFLNRVLFLADWILNFPQKMLMIGAKILAGIVLYVGYLVMKHIGPINKWIKAGWGKLISQILIRFVSLLAKTASKITKSIIDGLAWVIKTIINGILDGVAWLIKTLQGIIVDAIAWYIKRVIDTLGGLIASIIGLFSEDGEKAFREDVLKVSKGVIDKAAELSKSVGAFITDRLNTVSQAILNPVVDIAAALAKVYLTSFADFIGWGMGWAADAHKNWSLDDSSDASEVDSSGNKLQDNLVKGKDMKDSGKLVSDIDNKSKDDESSPVELNESGTVTKTPDKEPKKLGKNMTKPKNVQDSSISTVKEIEDKSAKKKQLEAEKFQNEIKNKLDKIEAQNQVQLQNQGNSGGGQTIVKPADKIMWRESSARINNQNQT